MEPVLEEQIRAWGLNVIGKELFRGCMNSAGTAGGEILGLKLNPLMSWLRLLPTRPRALPGCPHRGIFYQLNRMKITVNGDIGCYTLGALPPLASMDSCVCMGGSIGMALGMEKARGKEFARKQVAVIGDSTFVHSGITPLIDVVYNRGTTTVLILDNGTTAMTGHQDHPGTGKDVWSGDPPSIWNSWFGPLASNGCG